MYEILPSFLLSLFSRVVIGKQALIDVDGIGVHRLRRSPGQTPLSVARGDDGGWVWVLNLDKDIDR